MMRILKQIPPERHVGDYTRVIASTCLSRSQRLPVGLRQRLRRLYATAALARKPPLLETERQPNATLADVRAGSSSSHFGSLARDVQVILRQDVGGEGAWLQRVERAVSDLERPRNRRIAVVGEASAAPRDLTSALLQDPISDLTSTRHALLTRHKDSQTQRLDISYGQSHVRTPDRLSLPSAWLHSTACDIVEIQPQSGSQILDWALEVDAVVVVVDPIRLLTPMMLQSLRPVIASGRPIVVVVNGRAISTRSTEESIGLISESLRSIDATIPLSNIIVTESSLALRAYEALYTGLQRPDATPSTRSKAFEIFQHAYTSSDIGSLQRLLSGLIADGYQERTAISTVALALESAFISIASDRQQLREAEATVAELDAIGSRATAHARNISAVHRALDGALLEGSIDDELARAQHDVQHLFMTRFAWTALLLRLRIDDVGSELAAYINGTFGVNLEKQLIFETGQLAQVQRQLDHQADDTVRRLALSSDQSARHPLASPILRNHLSALALAVPEFTPTTLLDPLYRRRRQLVEVSVGALQQSARRALGTTVGLGLVGVTASWWMFVPPVAVVTSFTAVGLGLLSVIGGVAWGQHRWSRAQHRFWQEWKRSTGMLRGDLQNAFEAALATRVRAKSTATSEGLQQLVERRRNALDGVEAKLGRAREAVKVAA